MQISKKIRQTVEIMVDAVCNMCGKSCIPPKCIEWPVGKSNSPELYGLIETKVGTGFSSPALTDGSTYTFSICEFCLKEMFSKFKVPVQVCRFLPGKDRDF